MLRTLRLSTQWLTLGAALFLASGAPALPAPGQTASGEIGADCSSYASVLLPPEAVKDSAPKAFPTCASYRSYRGVGRPVNYADARACAWQERLAQQAGLPQNPEAGTAWFVGGSLILADLYLNGAGVPRNLSLAMHFACESDKAMAELALSDPAKFKASSRPQRLYEICDDAATTLTQNFCAEYASEIKDDRRTRYYKSLSSSMSTEQNTAFQKLLSAQNAYVLAHASEVDQSGTIHDIRTLTSQDILNSLFKTEVLHLQRKNWPKLSSRQVATADSVLRRQYEETLRRLRTRPKEDTYPGAVTADNLSKVEKAWETYRDAWVAFARRRYPADVASIRAEITFRRYLLLKTIS